MYSQCAKALAKVVEFTLGKKVSPKHSQFFLCSTFKFVMYSQCAKALPKVVEFTLGKQVSPKLSQFFLWIKKKTLLSID
jgi:hypothetical protein